MILYCILKGHLHSLRCLFLFLFCPTLSARGKFFFSFCRKFWKCFQLFIIFWCPNTKNIFSQKKYGIDLTWRKFHFSMLDCKNKIWLKVQNEKKNLIVSYLFSNLFEVQGTASVQTIFYIPWKKNWKLKKGFKPCKKVAKGSVTFVKANRHGAKRRDDLFCGQFIANLLCSTLTPK